MTYHIDLLSGVSGACEASSDDSCVLGPAKLHFKTLERFEKFQFLAQAPGSKPCGYLSTKDKLAEELLELANLVKAGAYPTLKDFVEERIVASVYRDALAKRDVLKAQLSVIGEKLDKVKAQTKLVRKATVAKALLEERELTLQYRDVNEIYRLLLAQLGEYRLLTAQAAFSYGLLREESERARGVFQEYSKETLGSLKSVGEFEANSPAWHEARAGGIGGSDVGSLMRVDRQWGAANYNRLVNSKLGIDDPNARKIDSYDLRTGIGRGNAWEEFLRYDFMDRNPQSTVMFCKKSWEQKDPELSYRKANFDGLLVNDAQEVTGVLEIKTSSDAEAWGDVTLGLYGVPESYRKQVLWYALNAGLTHGVLAVIIDDHDYREYKFSVASPEIAKEIEEIDSAVTSFQSELEELKKKHAAGEDITRKRNRRGMTRIVEYKAIAEVYAGYAGISEAKALKQLVTSIEAEKKAKGRILTDEEFQLSALAVFATHDPSTRTKPLIGVDIETSGASPRSGRIIETGIARLDNTGAVAVVYSSLHSIPKLAFEGVGLGQTEIHQITESMLEGAPEFDDPKVQEEVLAYLKSGTLVAHNAGFEDRFFITNLKGYVEAKNRGEITILCTQKLASFLMPKSDNSSLASFAEDNGVPYEGAHAATQDAVMMLKALGRLQSSLHKTGVFKPKNISRTLRLKAQETAVKSSENR